MEFFELGIERIHQLISICFSQAMERGLLYASLSLSLGILSILFCKKIKIFNRDVKALQIIARFYSVYIPLIMVLGGFALGASVATKEFFTDETSTHITPLMKLVFPAYQSDVNTNWARVVQTGMTFNETVKEYVDEIKFTPRSNELKEQLSTFAANLMVPSITQWGIESVVSSAKDIAVKESEKQGYIEMNKVKALLIVRTMSMFDYPKGLWEETNERLEQKVVFYFESISFNIIMIFFLFLSLPFAETIVYKIYAMRKLKKSYAMERKFFTESNLPETKIPPTSEKEGKEIIPAIEMEIPKVFEN